MITTLKDFYSEATKPVMLFDSFAQRHDLVNRARADHICYKCGSKESFEHIRSLFEIESQFIYQSIISKRRIAFIKMKQGIPTALGEIYFLELSDQKPALSQVDGFDHIEVYPVNLSYDELVQELERSETVVEVERPHHTTHDITIENGFIFRCTHGTLLDKIKDSEMY